MSFPTSTGCVEIREMFREKLSGNIIIIILMTREELDLLPGLRES